ncbi:MAG: hypothetical protein KC613_12405 [Myxococcales bacterium]|nr:hypothetical protein [Myxococcales bacterium]MCB9526269.1 hypothetical protein [Myxococcales bacterium]
MSARARLRAWAMGLLALGAGGLAGCEQPELWEVPPPPGDARPPLPTTRDMQAPPDLGAPATAPRRYTLRLNSEPNPPLVLDMSREEVVALLGAIADDTVILELDPLPLLRNVLAAVKSACGVQWRQDVAEPRYDCDATALGRSFTRPGVPWQASPEFALVRLLTMTPANVIVRGTSIEFMQALSDIADIGGGFAQILADTLQIPRTQEIVPSEAVVRALKDHLIAPHPGTSPDGRLLVTLGDVLADMAPLSEKLGPAGGHPGVLDPAFRPRGIILTDDFRMRVRAQSRIRVFEGLSAALGRDVAMGLETPDRRPATTPLGFDFTDPDDFQLFGLVDAPTVDLKFRILEHPKFVPACLGVEAGCTANRPQTPVGDESVWRLDRWELEYVVAFAAMTTYERLVHEQCYVSCRVARVAVGQDGLPPGFADFGVPFDLGPAAQFVWELINEVVQVGLHGPDESDRREGEANVAFTVTDIPVGITGAQAAEAVRPLLERQSQAISDFLLGDFRANAGPVDFYFRRGSDGRPVLQFLAPEDLPPGQRYRHAQPGFFADAALTQKVSAQAIDGLANTTHEKWVVAPGETPLFIEDAAGDRWQITVFGSFPGAPTVDLEVRPAEAR